MNREEIIWCSRWKELCDYVYEPSMVELPSGIVGCDITNIREFFGKIKDLPNKYIVLSYRSDYGLEYQNEAPPAADIPKWIKFQLNPQTFGYNDLVCPARLNRDKCNVTDKYTVKCYSYTDSTFDTIPENVLHWFTVNCNITDSKVTPIPFGVYDTDEVINTIAEVSETEKDAVNLNKILYINFQFYTLERYEIFQSFVNETSKMIKEKVTIERDMPYKYYLKQIKKHHFIVSPPGNGLDCFRNLEAFYMGVKPIVQASRAMEMYILAGAVPYNNNNYESILLSLLNSDNNMFIVRDVDRSIGLWSYWSKKVLDMRNTFHL